MVAGGPLGIAGASSTGHTQPVCTSESSHSWYTYQPEQLPWTDTCIRVLVHRLAHPVHYQHQHDRFQLALQYM